MVSATRISFLEGETQGVEAGRGFLPQAVGSPSATPEPPRQGAPEATGGWGPDACAPLHT